MSKRKKPDTGDWGGYFTPAEHHAMRARLAAAHGCRIGRGGVVIRNDTGEPLTFPDADTSAEAPIMTFQQHPVRAALTAAGCVPRPDRLTPDTSAEGGAA